MPEPVLTSSQTAAVRNATRTKLVLLGTGGGPTVHKNPTRTGPASAVVVDGVPYLVDCGEGAPRQLIRAGMNFEDVNHVFITHQHFDHNSDLGNFLAYAWYAGRREPVNVWGPPRLTDMLADFVRLNSFDFRLRELETGRPPFDPIPLAHEIDMEGPITEGAIELLSDERVTVSALRVSHGLVPSVAYRFKTPDLDITFSGDRGGEDDIVNFSTGTDVLVHEVLHYEAMRKYFPHAPEAVFTHHRNDHTSPEDVGRIATEAQVGSLVLNHILPDNESLVSAHEWTRLVRTTFAGEIIVGTDVMEV